MNNTGLQKVLIIFIPYLVILGVFELIGMLIAGGVIESNNLGSKRKP